MKIAIIGSGPAGFYTASKLLKHTVHMYEALPFPYGLVRYGVAPDHPDVKSVQSRFDSIASNISFYGNVRLGRDISISQLRTSYDAVCLAYGASRDKRLNIENEEYIIPSRSFVNYYNGYPNSSSIHLSGDAAVIIGNGNVALDIARTLLSDELERTDISSDALNAIKSANIRTVTIIGRRSPYDVKFTAKEFRELSQMVDMSADIELFNRKIDGRKSRLIELMKKSISRGGSSGKGTSTTTSTTTTPTSSFDKKIRFEFNQTPLKVIPGTPNTLVTLNSITNKTTSYSGTIFKAIGYESVPVEGLPFDHDRGIVPNEQGRVINCDGVYVSGWLKTGASGVIATTMYDAFQTAECILNDLDSKKDEEKERPDMMLHDKVISFHDWKRVEAEEKRRGEEMGKISEKFKDLETILNFLNK